LVSHQSFFIIKILLYNGIITTLSRLCLVENLWNHQLSIFLFFASTKVVLMHHPIGLLGLLLSSIVGVEDKDFLETLHSTTYENWSCFSCFVPPCLASFFISVNLSSFPCSGCVRFRWPVKEVADLSIFAYTCNSSRNIN